MSEEEINLLKKISNKGHLTEKEYLYISGFVRNKNLLVFGTGNDTPYWKLLGSFVVFLENSKRWFDKTDPNQYLVHYQTKKKESDTLLSCYRSGVTNRLEMDLPNIVYETSWDAIFVDGPQGWGDDTPGRMQSLYMAKTLSNKNTDVFVHDFDREVERVWSLELFSNMVNLVDKIVHLRV